MKSFDRQYLEGFVIPHRLIARIRQIGKYERRQELNRRQAPEMVENSRKVATVQSTESSNRHECITADFKKIKELVAEQIKPPYRSKAEIAGYQDGLITVQTNPEPIPFTANIVLQINQNLMKYTAQGGQWKSFSEASARELDCITIYNMTY